MIYVDSVQYYPETKKYWCHMATDSDIAELHKMAEQIGLKLGWFQNHPFVPHYDLSPGKRKKAIEHGAISVGTLELAKRCGIR